MELTDYEKETLRIMLKSEFTDLEVDHIISTSPITNYDFTGAGYFIELTNQLFPSKRKVISEPSLIGSTDCLQLGFILFLENKSLTLECHSWGDINIPDGIRAKRVSLKTT